MEDTKLNLAYGLQSTHPIYFVICKLCHWCATYFNINDTGSPSSSLSLYSLACHTCNSNNSELIPISTDESFRINYTPAMGMEMEFYKNSK